MKKDLLIVFLLSLVTVILLISGILAISEIDAMAPKILSSGVLFSLAVGTSISLSDAIKWADRTIINYDDENAYEYFTKELEEMQGYQKNDS